MITNHHHLRGHWQPARLTHGDLISLMSVTVLMVLIRGADYATGRDQIGPSLTVVERAAPLILWAGACIGAGAILLAGMILKRHAMVWLGHCLLTTVYLALFLGIVLSVLWVPYLDGIRGAGVLLLPIALHGILAGRTGPRPASRSDSHPVEIIRQSGSES